MPYSSLKLGISYENETDLMVIQELLNRFRSEKYAIEISIPCKTGIIGFVRIHTKAFFDLHKVDIAIYITDQDFSDAKETRINKIKEEIIKVNPLYIENSVIVLCNPHIEKWLVSDHNAVKKVFSLPSEEPLPFASDKPKEQLDNIRKNNQTMQLSKHEAYTELAKAMHIKTVREICPEFNNFCNDLKEKSKGIFTT